jgi:hypothetical protein
VYSSLFVVNVFRSPNPLEQNPGTAPNKAAKKSAKRKAPAASGVVPVKRAPCLNMVSVAAVLIKLHAVTDVLLIENVLLYVRGELVGLSGDQKLDEVVLVHLELAHVRPLFTRYVRGIYRRLVQCFADCGEMKLYQFQRLTEQWFAIINSDSVYNEYLDLFMPMDWPPEQCCSQHVLLRSPYIFAHLTRGIYHVFSCHAQVRSTSILASKALASLIRSPAPENELTQSAIRVAGACLTKRVKSAHFAGGQHVIDIIDRLSLHGDELPLEHRSAFLVAYNRGLLRFPVAHLLSFFKCIMTMLDRALTANRVSLLGSKALTSLFSEVCGAHWFASEWDKVVVGCDLLRIASVSSSTYNEETRRQNTHDEELLTALLSSVREMGDKDGVLDAIAPITSERPRGCTGKNTVPAEHSGGMRPLLVSCSLQKALTSSSDRKHGGPELLLAPDDSRALVAVSLDT